MQLAPQEVFPIVYLISDPSDTATYYVQAVMRNSATGATIRTINLTNRGNRRFSANTQVPDDSSGQAFHIDITVSVYTDSGYTTKSANYQEENTRYLVAQRWNLALSGGSGMVQAPGAAIDYKKLAEVVLEAFNSLPTTELPQVDLTGLYAQGDAIRSLLAAIKIPEAKEVDLKSHTDTVLSAISAAFKSLKIPELDLQPVLAAIEAIEFPKSKDYEPHFSKLGDALKALMPKIEQYNKYAKFGNTVESLVKEYGGGTKPPSSADTPKPEYDPRVKALFT